MAVSWAAWACSAPSAKLGLGKTTSGSSGRIAPACSQASAASGQVIATCAPMSTYWLPWPGKTKARSPSGDPVPKATPSGVANASPFATLGAALMSFWASSAPSAATTLKRHGAAAS